MREVPRPPDCNPADGATGDVNAGEGSANCDSERNGESLARRCFRLW